MKCIVITPSASQPRFHKRVSELAALFDEVFIYTFSREYYQCNTFPDLPNIHIYKLGIIKDGKYLQRIPSFMRAFFIIKRNLPKTNTPLYFYAFSFDCLLLAHLSGLKKGIYEIGDLISLNFLTTFVRLIEKKLLSQKRYLVLTSQKFISYYADLISPSRIYLIENKLNTFFTGLRPQTKQFTSERIVIGVIGLMRFEKPLRMLVEFVKNNSSRFSINCYGDGPFKTLFSESDSEYIRYFGPFKNPDDLQRIYSEIDLSFVVYDNSNYNVRVALPNKLYESAFFGVPLFVAEHTSLAEIVNEHDVGAAVSLESQDDFEKPFNLLNSVKLAAYSSNCFLILTDDLLDNGSKILQQIISRDVDP
jgi:succinoglycan biosynthesis protein ExoL